jgi:hypothetical protein
MESLIPLRAASRPVPSIKFQLPAPGKDGYCGVLYGIDDPTTEVRIIDGQFAAVLALVLHPYYTKEPSLFRKTNAETVARDLQSWVSPGRLRRAFYMYLEKSRTDKDEKIYQAVEKCDEEIVEYGKTVLEDYESRLEGDKAGDETVIQLRTELFLNLYLGNELDLLVGEQERIDKCGQPSRYRLEWWKRLDGRFAILELRSSLGVDSPTRLVTVSIAGDIISELESQGIVVTTLTRESKMKGSTMPTQG